MFCKGNNHKTMLVSTDDKNTHNRIQKKQKVGLEQVIKMRVKVFMRFFFRIETWAWKSIVCPVIFLFFLCQSCLRKVMERRRVVAAEGMGEGVGEGGGGYLLLILS